MKSEKVNHVYTSGQAALNYLKNEKKDKIFSFRTPKRF